LLLLADLSGSYLFGKGEGCFHFWKVKLYAFSVSYGKHSGMELAIYYEAY